MEEDKKLEKRKNIEIVVLSIIIVVLLGVLIYLLFIKKDKPTEPTKSQDNQQVVDNNQKEFLNGIYTLNDCTIYLYQINNKKNDDINSDILVLDMEKTPNSNFVNSGNHSTSVIKMSDVNSNSFKWKDNFGVTYTFEFINNSIKLSKDKTDQKDYYYNEGVYNKTKNYGLEDFYERWFDADKSLFASSDYMYSAYMKTNVEGKNPEGKRKIVMYQPDKNTVYVDLYFEKGTSKTLNDDNNINSQFTYYDTCRTEIHDGGALQTANEDLVRCKINPTTIDNKKGFIVNIELYDEDNSFVEIEKTLSGTYTIDSKMTIEDLIYDRFDNYFK